MKIDFSSIEGYESMTAEEKLAALEAMDIPEPDYSGWVKKDVAEIYAAMPAEQVAPLIITTIAVSLLKVVAIAGAILLIKWIIRKIKK